MIVVTLNFEDGSSLGAVGLMKPNPSMYDVRDGVKKWIEKYLNGTDIKFVWGTGEVRYTTSGADPVRRSLWISRSLEAVLIAD